jgi:hypothetical protein
VNNDSVVALSQFKKAKKAKVATTSSILTQIASS